MATKRLIGYIVMLLGVALILVRLFGSKMNISLPGILAGNILWIVAVALIAVGVWLTLGKNMMGQEGRAAAEVPIYHGKEIVGYRRKA
jgi:hypothetical protein